MKNLEKILDEAVRRGLTEALQTPRESDAERPSAPDGADPGVDPGRPAPREPLTSLP